MPKQKWEDTYVIIPAPKYLFEGIYVYTWGDVVDPTRQDTCIIDAMQGGPESWDPVVRSFG